MPAEEKPAEAAPAETPTFDIPNDMSLAYSIDNLLLFLSAVLVIFMQAGFALVETGLNSAKNAVNILFKNTIDFCLGVLAFYFIGYALMYPGADFAGKYFGYAQPNFAAVPTAEGLETGGGIDVRHRNEALGIDHVAQLFPSILDLANCCHIGHRATCGHVGKDHIHASTIALCQLFGTIG